MQELTSAQTEDIAGGLTFKCPILPIKRPPITTMAVGEEGGGGITTMMVGEEDKATTLAIGEEGGGIVTTLALGEEGGGPVTSSSTSALGAF